MKPIQFGTIFLKECKRFSYYVSRMSNARFFGKTTIDAEVSASLRIPRHIKADHDLLDLTLYIGMSAWPEKTSTTGHQAYDSFIRILPWAQTV